MVLAGTVHSQWIGDIAMLAREHDSRADGPPLAHVPWRTEKTGKAVFLPIPEELRLALNAVPTPRGAALGLPVFRFWNGITSERALRALQSGPLAAVFKKSGGEERPHSPFPPHAGNGTTRGGRELRGSS